MYNKIMYRLGIALLGPPQILCDGELVHTNRRKAIALLVYLAVTGIQQTREQLTTLLWPDYEQANAFAYLRRTVWDLNQMLGKGWIISSRAHVVLNREGLWLDTAVFEEFRRRKANRIKDLTDAVVLYRGDFLAGFSVAGAAPFEAWQRQQSEYLRQEFGDTLRILAQAHAQIGEYTTALDYSRRWLALDSLNETAHRAIMRLYAGMGDRTAAIRQYEECDRILRAELGIGPQAETTELYEAICREVVRVNRQDGEASLHPLVPKPAVYLPIPSTRFIGRQSEIEQIRALVLDHENRLITLIGSGGVGKTRLAIQVVLELVDAFLDGVVFVSLAPLLSAEGMVSTVAKALEFSFYREPESSRQQLLDYLREKQLLLVLDNFEHLIGDGARKLVLEMLSAAPKLNLLVTSRIQLNMQGEQLFPVGGMETPNPAEVSVWKDIEQEARLFSAMQLFVDRAKRIQPQFALLPENLNEIAQICQLVDGLPLGLELAAAWLEILPPAEIAAEIRRGLGFLETDQADVPERQRSMRVVFESSWNLLTEDEQDTFERLSVFVGSFSRKAAEQVTGVSLRTLMRLAHKSWLQQTKTGRYQIHELMRQYGIMRLRENESKWRTARDSHAAFFATFMERQGAALRGVRQEAAIKAIAQEYGSNIPAAWDWLVSRGQFSVLIEKVLPGLYHFCDIRWAKRDLIPLLKSAREAVKSSIYQEATHQQEVQMAILASIETDLEFATRLWVDDPSARFTETWRLVQERGLEKELGLWFLLLARRYGWNVDFERGLIFQKQAVSFIRAERNTWELGYALLLMGGSLIDSHKFAEGEPCLREALVIFQELKANREQAEIFSFLGDAVLNRDGNLDEYNRLKQVAQALYESVGDQYGVGCLWQGFAVAYSCRGEHDLAFRAFQRQRQIYEALGNRRVLGDCLHQESLAASKYSSHEHALVTRRQALDIAIEIGDKHAFAWRAWQMGDIHRIAGDFSQAQDWYEKANLIFEELQVSLGKGIYQRGYGDIALAQGKLSEARQRFQAYLACAERQQPPHMWSVGYALAKLARVFIAQGDMIQGRAMINKALAAARSWNRVELSLLALSSLVMYQGALENTVQAIELAAFVANHPVCWNETKKQTLNLLETISLKLPEDTVQAAYERGKGYTLENFIQHLLGS